MKISMWTSFLYEWQPEAAISVLARHGFSAAELSTEHAQMLLDRGDAETEGLKFKSHCDALGFDIHHGHFYLYIDLAVKEKADQIKVFDNMKRWCDLFNAIGIKAGVVHACKGPLVDGSRERSAAILESLLEYSKGMSFSFCLENLKSAYATYEDVKGLIDMIRDPEHRLAYCLDTGHVACNDGDCAEYVRKAGSGLKALHVTDCLLIGGKKDDHYFPYIHGMIDWKAFVRALRDVDYQGLFNYEVPRERGVPEEILMVKLDYARELAKAMLQM